MQRDLYSVKGLAKYSWDPKSGYMLTLRAQWPVLELMGLVCYSDLMSSSLMVISVYYWTSDFVIRG